VGDKLVDKLEPLEGLDLSVKEPVGTGRPSDNVGSGIVADSLLAYGTPDRVLTKGFLGWFVQHSGFTLDAKSGMDPRPDHRSSVLLDELLLQKQSKNGFLPKLQQTSVATQGQIDESTPLVETTRHKPRAALPRPERANAGEIGQTLRHKEGSDVATIW
jgi:hypothetical protein